VRRVPVAMWVRRSGYIGLTARHQLIVLDELRRVISSTSITRDSTASDMTSGSSLNVIVIDELMLTASPSLTPCSRYTASQRVKVQI